MQFESTTKPCLQILTMNHGGIPPEAARTMARVVKDGLSANLKASGVKATVSIKYRANNFKLLVKFASLEEQKKLEDI